MALRIGDYVAKGEINNVSRNTVHGWVEFAEDNGVRFDLAGNLPGELAGRHLRFSASPPKPYDPVQRPDIEAIEVTQIGVMGTVSINLGSLSNGSSDDSARLIDRGESRPADEKQRLYFEWFSQNGRIIAEIVDPQIEDITEETIAQKSRKTEPSPDACDDSELDSTDCEEGDIPSDADDFVDEEIDEQDPYDLFPDDFEAMIAASSGDGNGNAAFPDSDTSSATSSKRSWDEIIPGIDPETKRMYELWDEMFDGTKDVPISTLFDPPMKLPPADQMSDEKVDELLTALLARLAVHRIALDICEHYSPRESYRYLMEDILPQATIYPNISATGFIRHYSTWENCPLCDAEFDAEYEARKKAEQDEPPESES